MKRIALALPLLLLATACGGSDKAGGLAKSDYVSKAEAICKKANADQKALSFPTTPAALPTYAQQLLDLAERATTQLEALEPPADDKAELQSKVLTPLNGQLAQGKTYVAQLKAAVAAKDQKKIAQLVSNPPTGSKADLDWMRSYGFKECVEAADTEG